MAEGSSSMRRRQRRAVPGDQRKRLLQRAGLAGQQVGQQERQLAGRSGPGELAACASSF